VALLVVVLVRAAGIRIVTIGVFRLSGVHAGAAARVAGRGGTRRGSRLDVCIGGMTGSVDWDGGLGAASVPCTSTCWAN
jgi:hypothetical protein